MANRERLYSRECELCSFFISPNGVFTIVAKDVVHTTEKRMIAYSMISHLTDGVRMPLLLDLTDASLIMSDLDTRERMASELPSLFSAVGVVAVTPLQKVAPTIFLNTMARPVPICVFESHAEAMQWLERFLCQPTIR